MKMGPKNNYFLDGPKNVLGRGRGAGGGVAGDEGD